jgi:hypothetical protein
VAVLNLKSRNDRQIVDILHMQVILPQNTLPTRENRPIPASLRMNLPSQA